MIKDLERIRKCTYLKNQRTPMIIMLDFKIYKVWQQMLKKKDRTSVSLYFTFLNLKFYKIFVLTCILFSNYQHPSSPQLRMH